VFFTLDYNGSDVLAHFAALDFDNSALPHPVIIDTSDDICADHIINCLSGIVGNSVAVVDCLQLLDQKRSNPNIREQISALRSFTKARGAIIVMFSQIDRSFEFQGKALPDMTHVRLPNPLDLTLFDKTCFMHDGEVRIGAPT
jgi:hypothetical protein